MTNNPVIVCSKCGRLRRLHKRGMCGPCYNHPISRARYKRLVGSFKTRRKYNKFLFDLYVEHRKGSKIFFEHIQQIERLIAVLKAQPVPRFKNWFEIYEFSEANRTGVNPDNPRKWCPFVLIGKSLERQGLLEGSPKTYPMYLCYRVINEGSRRHVVRYMEEVLRLSKHPDVAIWWLRLIRDFAVWNNGELLEVSTKRAEEYLSGLSPNSEVMQFLERLSVLRKFYKWMCEEGIKGDNPFAAANLGPFCRMCPKCGKIKLVPAGGSQCRLCHIHIKASESIEGFEAKLKDASAYNQYLFKLYLAYIKRYRITNVSWIESKWLLNVLQTHDVPPLLTWRDVNSASELYRQTMTGYRIIKGDPFTKIGHMLVELGVIPVRAEDEFTRLNQTFDRFKGALGPEAKEYCLQLIQRKRRGSTAAHVATILLLFEQWLLVHHSDKDPFNLESQVVENYLAQIPIASRDSRLGTIKKFYGWCQHKKLCDHNPLDGIARPKPLAEMAICSKEQVAAIMRYLKDPATDPLRAMTLALNVLWAFNTKELRYSTFKIVDDCIEVQVFQAPLSYAHKTPTRPDIFRLPKEPKWFGELQKRFWKDWQTRFGHLQDSKDKQYLLPVPSGRYRRPASGWVIMEQISKATKEATGKPIPPQVLRCTAGHFHTHGTDASLLTQLGWASASAFRYTWVPRKFTA
jgi:site-specific recombinase XerD